MAVRKNSFSSPSSSFQSKPFRLILGRAIGSSPSVQSCRLTTFRRYLGPFLSQDLFAETLKHNPESASISISRSFCVSSVVDMRALPAGRRLAGSLSIGDLNCQGALL